MIIPLLSDHPWRAPHRARRRAENEILLLPFLPAYLKNTKGYPSTRSAADGFRQSRQPRARDRTTLPAQFPSDNPGLRHHAWRRGGAPENRLSEDPDPQSSYPPSGAPSSNTLNSTLSAPVLLKQAPIQGCWAGESDLDLLSLLLPLHPLLSTFSISTKDSYHREAPDPSPLPAKTIS
jgi:hypothetical protein